MKISSFLAGAVGLVLTASAAMAAGNDNDDSTVIAKQGAATVLPIDVDAHVATMRPQLRAGFINSPKRIEQMLSQMLLRKNLAIQARELGIDKDPIVQREIESAAESILMRRRIELFREQLEVPDLAQLVKERYLAEAAKFRTDDQAEVVHLLLKTGPNRDDAEARKQLMQWREDVLAGKAELEDLAEKYSDEPAAKSTRGLLKKAGLSQYVQPFSQAVRELRNPKDLSMPVKTDFGWHLIELRSFEPGRQLAFEEVEDALLAAERDKYLAAEQEKFISQLQELPIEASEASIAPLRERYGKLEGEQPAVSKPDAAGTSAPPGQ